MILSEFYSSHPKCVEAYWFAHRAHKGQLRGDKIRPYIVHPEGVAALLIAAGVTDEEVICAALLHDTLEDTETTYENLVESFGLRVAGLVLEVTDDPNLSKPEQKASQIQRGPDMSQEAKLIKLADKTYNVKDLRENPPGWKLESRIGYAEGCKDFVCAAEKGLTGPDEAFDALWGMFFAEFVKTVEVLEKEEAA